MTQDISWRTPAQVLVEWMMMMTLPCSHPQSLQVPCRGSKKNSFDCSYVLSGSSSGRSAALSDDEMPSAETSLETSETSNVVLPANVGNWRFEWSYSYTLPSQDHEASTTSSNETPSESQTEGFAPESDSFDDSMDMDSPQDDLWDDDATLPLPSDIEERLEQLSRSAGHS